MGPDAIPGGVRIELQCRLHSWGRGFGKQVDGAGRHHIPDVRRETYSSGIYTQTDGQRFTQL